MVSWPITSCTCLLTNHCLSPDPIFLLSNPDVLSTELVNLSYRILDRFILQMCLDGFMVHMVLNSEERVNARLEGNFASC